METEKQNICHKEDFFLIELKDLPAIEGVDKQLPAAPDALLLKTTNKSIQKSEDRKSFFFSQLDS